MSTTSSEAEARRARSAIKADRPERLFARLLRRGVKPDVARRTVLTRGLPKGPGRKSVKNAAPR